MRNPLLSDLCREHRAKPVPPKSDGLMADFDPALRQGILDVSQRQWVPHLHHYDQTDHFWQAVEISECAAHGPELPRSEAARRIIPVNKIVPGRLGCLQCGGQTNDIRFTARPA